VCFFFDLLCFFALVRLGAAWPPPVGVLLGALTTT
jgi:hypothetical protein